jgi:hypothetical protein
MSVDLERESAADDPDLAASVRRLFDLELRGAPGGDEPEEEE